MALSVLITASAAWWVLVTPDNPLTSLFRRQISDVDARVVIGPYPADRDFRLLKQHNVGLVVSLLDPAIPYEATLLEREKAVAAEHGIRLENYPMSSILGQKFGNYYDESAAKAAAAIAGAASKVYLHCYLGQHRIQAVRTLLAAKGMVAGTYAVRAGERGEAAKQLDLAEAAFNNGQYPAALEALARIDDSQLTDNARLLRAWSHYRSGDIARARGEFQAVADQAAAATQHPAAPQGSVAPQHLAAPPNQPAAHPQAAIGLGYCAYRDGDYLTAETQFLAALQRLPENADALGGLGLTYYRANRPDDAEKRLQAALTLAPANQELRDVLDRVRASK